jgi:conjugative transfer signal peptidase TraF
MTIRRSLQLFYIAVATVSACALTVGLGRTLVWNETASLPRGLYLVERTNHLHAQDLVALDIPANVARLVSERHYMPSHQSTLLKHVAALPGDSVCISNGVLAVNGADLGPTISTDTLGRPLPEFEFCGPVPPGHVFLASSHPRSFDSRMFGFVSIEHIRGKASPLLELESGH